MILSFINIRKVPLEMLKTLGFANVNEWKIMFDPYIDNSLVTKPPLLMFGDSLSHFP